MLVRLRDRRASGAFIAARIRLRLISGDQIYIRLSWLVRAYELLLGEVDRFLRSPILFVSGLDALDLGSAFRFFCHFLRLGVEWGKDWGRGNFMLVRAHLVGWVGCLVWGYKYGIERFVIGCGRLVFFYVAE